MELLRYFLTAVILAISAFMGFFISKETEEELTVGKKYFRIITLVSFIAAAAFSLFSFFKEVLYIPIFICAVLCVVFSYLLYKTKNYHYYFYCAAAILFFIAKFNPLMFYYASASIGLLFISTASLQTSEHIEMLKKHKLKLLRKILVGPILFLVFSSALFFLIN